MGRPAADSGRDSALTGPGAKPLKVYIRPCMRGMGVHRRNPYGSATYLTCGHFTARLNDHGIERRIFVEPP